jgi:NADH dehydrogenase
MLAESHHVVIIGGGFGGLYAARRLRKAPVRVALIDRRNFHLFQPLLYQVATGGLSPANIAAPLRAVLRRQTNTEVLLGEVTNIDVASRRILQGETSIAYDSLIVATGSRHFYFGHDDWERFAPSLKTIEDATAIRARILSGFEAAERETDPSRRQPLLTFVIVGGGPTGVELAGNIGELARYTLRGNFRHINPGDAHILLVEGTDRILPAYLPKLSASAVQQLGELGVTVWTDATVTDIQPGCVTIRRGQTTETVRAHTVLWAAGVQASPLGRILAQATGATLDRAGRITVAPDLTLPGHPEIFVIGDLAIYPHQTGKPLPGIAPVAMQQGRYAADLIVARLQGKTLPPFQYHDRGSMATIGRSRAVVDLGWIRLSGFFAWLVWLFVHLIYLIEFGNRILVVMQWAGNYVTRNRSARLITGGERPDSRTSG